MSITCSPLLVLARRQLSLAHCLALAHQLCAQSAARATQCTAPIRARAVRTRAILRQQLDIPNVPLCQTHLFLPLDHTVEPLLDGDSEVLDTLHVKVGHLALAAAADGVEDALQVQRLVLLVRNVREQVVDAIRVHTAAFRLELVVLLAELAEFFLCFLPGEPCIRSRCECFL